MSDVFFDGSEDDEKVLNNEPMIPDGDYKVFLVEVTKDDSRNNPLCKMYTCKFSIADGPYQGLGFTNRMVYEHPSSEYAVKLGRARFKSLCKALCGQERITSSTQIQNKSCLLKLKNKESKNGYMNLEIIQCTSTYETKTPDDCPF